MAPPAKSIAQKIWLGGQIIWIVVCVWVLVHTLVAYHQSHNEEVGIILIYLMTTLSFPSGWLIVFMLSGLGFVLYKLFGFYLPGGYPGIILDWLIIFAAGYFQWFILIPFIAKKQRAKPQG